MHSLAVEQAFRDAMFSADIAYSGEIIADGKLHRFHVEGDKLQSRNGWLVLHHDGMPSGAFGSWKTGLSSTWCSKSKNQMTAGELAEHHRRVANTRHQIEQARAEQQQLTANRACHIWSIAQPANQHHPYLLKKSVTPYNLRQIEESLLVPLVDVAGRMYNLQMIVPDGNKRFLYGGRIRSVFCLVGDLPTARCLYLCEGWATAMSIRNLIGCTVIAAMTANNLKPTAIALRSALPAEVSLIIAADNDRHTQGNQGVTKGREAAESVGANLTWPRFVCNDCKCTDFNDLHNCERKHSEVKNGCR
jgi:putative DNA primase/helicase